MGGFNLTTTYARDDVGNVTSATDPGGNDTWYIYNALDQVVRRTSREVSPGSGLRYERDTFYDLNDNVVRVDVQNKDDLLEGVAGLAFERLKMDLVGSGSWQERIAAWMHSMREQLLGYCF